MPKVWKLLAAAGLRWGPMARQPLVHVRAITKVSHVKSKLRCHASGSPVCKVERLQMLKSGIISAGTLNHLLGCKVDPSWGSLALIKQFLAKLHVFQPKFKNPFPIPSASSPFHFGLAPTRWKFCQQFLSSTQMSRNFYDGRRKKYLKTRVQKKVT